MTEIAALVRQSHPLVIGWIKQLGTLGFIETRSDPKDARRSVVALTREGRSEVRRLHRALVVMGETSQRLMDEATGDVFQALRSIDEAIRHKPILERLREEAANPGSPR